MVQNKDISNIENQSVKNELITHSDLSGNIILANDAYCQLSGYSLEELMGESYKLVRNPDTPTFIYKELWRTISSGQEWKGLIKNRNKQGKPYIINTIISPILDDSNNILYYKSLSNEVTDFINLYDSLNKASKYPITNIDNRNVMFYDIETREKDYFQIAILDIDNFKHINDYYGYKIGDELIKCVGDVILSCTQEHKTLKVYHISIDEFVLVHILDTSDALNTDLCDIAKEIINKIELNQMEVHNDIKIDISVSIGMAGGNDTYETIKHADMALEYSKDNHLQISMFNKIIELREKLETLVYWTAQLKIALNNDRIIPWLQPIIHNKTGKIVKFEALMRLIDDHNEIISPFKFLEIAKKNKLYDRVSTMMITKTFEYFITNHDHFNINLTWEDLKGDEIKLLILDYLDKYEDIGSRLTIEIVESESIENYELFIDFINTVKKKNVSIALDDFGSGYSNFVYLEKLNIDCIKIDGSLIQGMMTNQNTLFIVESIVKIAKKLKVETVAEFVSSEEIYKRVKKLGIDYSQGFHFGKPRPTTW